MRPSHPNPGDSMPDTPPQSARYARSRAALPLAVVVREVAVPALRPAARQWTAARIATHETPERKIWMMPRSWSCHDDTAIENSLHAIERGLVDQGVEIAAG